MPSGKVSHSRPDTLLYFGELLMSRMRVALDRTLPVGEGQDVGADMNDFPFVEIPVAMWKPLKKLVIEPMSKKVGLKVTVSHPFYTGAGSVRVEFRRAGAQVNDI
jgi:hypothetical protein